MYPHVQWANQDPPPQQTGYKNPGWPGCCRPPYPSEINMIAPADWPAVSIVHRIPTPVAVADFLSALRLPPLTSKAGNGHTTSHTGSMRSPSRSTSRKGNGAALMICSSKPSTKPLNVPSTGRGRQTSISPDSNNDSRSNSTGISSSLPSSPTNENHSKRKASITSVDRRTASGEGPYSSHSSPSRKQADLGNSATPRRISSVRRPAPSPATTSVSISTVVASDMRSSEIRCHDSPPSTLSNRQRGSASNSPSTTAARNGDRFLVPRSSKMNHDCRSSSSGSSDGMLSDSTITSEGFTDYLSDESEVELQRQAEARAAVVAQSQMEELEFKMARQELARIGLEPPKSWTQTNPQTKSPNQSTMSSTKIPGHSFAVAATAIMQTGS